MAFFPESHDEPNDDILKLADGQNQGRNQEFLMGGFIHADSWNLEGVKTTSLSKLKKIGPNIPIGIVFKFLQL